MAQAILNEMVEKEQQSEALDRAISDKRTKLNKEKGSELLGAVADWATGKSKALKGDIEDLKLDLAEAHEAIAEERKRTQAEVAKLEAYKKTVAQQMESAVQNAVQRKDDEVRNLKERLSWRNKVLNMFTRLLARNNATFRNAIDAIIRFAKDTYSSIFNKEEVKTIKSVMEPLEKTRRTTKPSVLSLCSRQTRKKTSPIVNTEKLFVKWMMLPSAGTTKGRNRDIR